MPMLPLLKEREEVVRVEPIGFCSVKVVVHINWSTIKRR